MMDTNLFKVIEKQLMILLSLKFADDNEGYEPVIINNVNYVFHNVGNVAVGSSSNILVEGQYLSSC